MTIAKAPFNDVCTCGLIDVTQEGWIDRLDDHTTHCFDGAPCYEEVPEAPTITFRQLRDANVTRCKKWHPGFLVETEPTWTGADWSNAMCGEAGEAANVVKKIRRLETGTAPGPDDPPERVLLEMLACELADIVCYADLLAAFYGIDLDAALVDKFNAVSQRQGFPDRLVAE